MTRPPFGPAHSGLEDPFQQDTGEAVPISLGGELRRASEARREAEERLRLVVAHAPVVLWSVDREGTFTLSEGRGLEAMGLGPGEVVGRSALDLYGSVRVLDDAGGVTTGERLLRRALRGEPASGLAEIGALRFDTKMVPLRGPSGEVAGVIGVATDVTERVRAEDSFRAAEASFRTLIERAPELIFVHRSGVVIYANPAAFAALGFQARGELEGRALGEIAHPADRALLATRADTMTESGRSAPSREVRLLRKDGRVLVTEVVGVPLVFDGEDAVASIARDLTERKHAQAELLEAGRLASLGTLAAGVAHEINNPLTYMIANLDYVTRLVRARADECRTAGAVNGATLAERLDELATALGVAHDGATRVRGIVKDLTTFARAGSDHRGLLDVRSVVEPVVNLVSNEIRHRARFTRDLRDVPLVEANEARLGQVLVNLLMNAAQAIPEGQADQNEIGLATFTDERGRAVIEVRDTGCGIPDEIADRIFDPFFTTKPTGAGKGLGLSICHGAVTALGGEIAVRPGAERGTVVRVAIPRAELGAPRAPRRISGPMLAVRPGRVLVVDDEPHIVSSLRRALMGHDVRVVTRSREALDLVLAGERFDAILCDLMMPVMTGMDLAHELERVAPDQAARMVFVTGGAFTARAREFLEHTTNPRLEKPLDLERLHAVIADLVRKKSA